MTLATICCTSSPAAYRAPHEVQVRTSVCAFGAPPDRRNSAQPHEVHRACIFPISNRDGFAKGPMPQDSAES
jgi:hypothetical protein